MRLAPGRSGALPGERGALLPRGLVQRERGSDAHRVALPATDGPSTAPDACSPVSEAGRPGVLPEASAAATPSLVFSLIMSR